MRTIYLLIADDFKDFKNLKIIDSIGFSHLKKYEPVILVSLSPQESTALIGLLRTREETFY